LSFHFHITLLNIFQSPLFLGSLGLVSFSILIGIFVTFYQKTKKGFIDIAEKSKKDRKIQLIKASVRAQEEERERIAADLHDDAGPLLATARLYLSDGLVNTSKENQLKTIQGSRALIDNAIALLRDISHTLMPPTLRNFGLAVATNDLFSKLNESGQVKATSNFQNYENRMDEEREMVAFRIIQELVTNYLKHSKGQFIHLIQNMDSEIVYIRLHHDGKGLTQAAFEDLCLNSKGLGIRNIENRISTLDGTINFDQDKERSFYRVTIAIPFKGGDD
jgi:two-component system, NarL family, sensor kinase